MRAILLNPGPVSLSDAVRKAAVQTDLCHREPEYFAVQDRVRTGLLNLYACNQEQWASVLLGGSGTTALEAMIASLVPRDGRLLVVENGVYGERISRIAKIHNIEYQAVHHQWLDAIDFDRVSVLLASGQFTHVAAVHHETTSGRLNDVFSLARLCEQSGTELMLDTVSSFAAEAIPFDSPALVACAVTANKCLHGIPGLCMVVCRKSAIEGAAEPPRSLYMHLPLWSQQQDRESTPFTPPVNSLLALDQAITELEDAGGWKARHARYGRLLDRVGRALRTYGVQTMLALSEFSCVLHSFRLPVGMSYQDLHDGLKQRGFVIYAGQGSLAAEMFRISTMGDITDYDMERLLAALHAVFAK